MSDSELVALVLQARLRIEERAESGRAGNGERATGPNPAKAARIPSKTCSASATPGCCGSRRRQLPAYSPTLPPARVPRRSGGASPSSEKNTGFLRRRTPPAAIGNHRAARTLFRHPKPGKIKNSLLECNIRAKCGRRTLGGESALPTLRFDKRQGRRVPGLSPDGLKLWTKIAHRNEIFVSILDNVDAFGIVAFWVYPCPCITKFLPWTRRSAVTLPNVGEVRSAHCGRNNASGFRTIVVWDGAVYRLIRCLVRYTQDPD